MADKVASGPADGQPLGSPRLLPPISREPSAATLGPGRGGGSSLRAASAATDTGLAPLGGAFAAGVDALVEQLRSFQGDFGASLSAAAEHGEHRWPVKTAGCFCTAMSAGVRLLGRHAVLANCGALSWPTRRVPTYSAVAHEPNGVVSSSRWCSRRLRRCRAGGQPSAARTRGRA